MSLNKKLKSLKSFIEIKEKFDKDDWDLFKIPSSLIDVLSNNKYSKNFLLNLLDKIEKSEGMSNNEMLVYSMISPYLLEDNNNDFDRIRNKIKMEYKNKEAEYKIYNPDCEFIYRNQKKAAEKIINLLDDKMAVSLVALPQVGKTGCFVWVTYMAMTNPSNNKMYFPEDIFIISGMSDIDWEKQTKNDMLDSIKNNVYHLGKIGTFNNIISNKRNTKILIIVDECQVATSKGQQIDCIIKEIEKNAEEKNVEIKYLVVSATPSVIYYDLSTWGNKHDLVMLEPPEKYVSFKTIIDEKRIFEADVLNEEYLNKNFLPLLKDHFTTPKYHIIRSSEKKRTGLVEWCKKNNFLCRSFDAKHRSSNTSINENPMLEEPIKHTFIIIKNFWRAGKRIKDKHIGIVYEYNNSIDINITAQGLIARFCGNDKQSKQTFNNMAPIFFGNIETLEEYMDFIKVKCNFNFANYTSAKLKISEGELIRRTASMITSIGKSSIKIGYSKKDYIDIPIVFDITDEQYNNMSTDNNTNSKTLSCILSIVKKINVKLHGIISQYKNTKNTIPDSESNYKRHIVDTKNCMMRGDVCKTDIKKEDQYNNVWTAFIDRKSSPKKVYIVVYHGKKLEQLKLQHIAVV